MSILKKAAEDLLIIADSIEKDAAEVTEFVCNKCNHTATLATINEKRLEAAKQVEGKEVKVEPITVNDKLNCPACDGVMAYNPTEASKPYYVEPEKEAKKEEEEEEEEKAASEPIDYDSLDRYAKKEE